MLYRIERGDRAEYGVVIEDGDRGHLLASDDTLAPHMGRNGKQSPRRPRIELTSSASPEEAAAIAAGIEQFLRDTAPAPRPAHAPGPWLRAGLFEGAGRDPHAVSPWGDADPWGR